MSHHQIALITIAAAVVLDVVCGLIYGTAEHTGAWLGLYCAEGNAVTEGACTSPHTLAGHVINAVEWITIVPLFAATFSLFTSGLSAIHIRGIHRRLDAMAAADGPVSGGAGGNPAGAGLTADGPVVPPPAAAERVEIVPLEAKGVGTQKRRRM